MKFDRSSLMSLAEQFEKKAEEFLEVADRIRNAASLFSDDEIEEVNESSNREAKSNGSVPTAITELEKAVLQSLSNKIAGREVSSIVSYCQHNVGIGTNNSIRTLCYRMTERNWMSRIERGRYQLTDLGKSIVNEVSNAELGQADTPNGAM